MSGLVKSVKKVFKKIVKSPIFKAIAIAAIVWFTAGTAAAYFAAPQAGLGAAMSSSASTMWSTTTSFFGADAAATATTVGNGFGGGNVAANSSGLAIGGGSAANAASAETIFTGLNGSTPLSEIPMNAISPVTPNSPELFTVGGGDMMGAGTVTPPANVLGEAGAGNILNPTTTVGGPTNYGFDIAAADAVVGAGTPVAAKTGMMGWLADNPMVTMMLGQGVTGAAAGYSADKEATRREEIEAKRLQDRGLMGFDHEGNRGTVQSQMGGTVAEAVAEPTTPAATAAPVAQQVAQQQVAAPITTAPQAPTPQQVPVPREQLPQMNKDGLIAGA
jgi:hypothetical protein